LNIEKSQLSKAKKDREETWKENQKLRQQTGIVNNKSLKTDYDKRENEISYLNQKVVALQNYH
jgi:hypothetical protein